MFFLILNSVSPGKTQVGFSNTYDFGTQSALAANIVIDADNLSMFGLGLSQNEPIQPGIFSCRFDSTEQFFDWRIYTDSLGDALFLEKQFEVVQKIPGGFIIAGALAFRKNGVMLKISESGSLGFIKEYQDSLVAITIFRAIRQYSDGFLIGGYKQNFDNSFDIVLFRTDDLGNPIWEKKFGTQGCVNLLNSIVLMDDNTIIVGGVRGAPLDTPVNERWYKSFIFATDSLGIIKWEWEYDGTENIAGLTGLHPTNDEGWIFISNERIVSSSTSEINKPIIVKLNSLMEVEWIFRTNPPVMSSFFNAFFGLAPTPDGGWVTAGWMLDESGLNLQGALYKISAEGDSVWSRLDTAFSHPEFGSENALHDVEALPSGSIVACGYSREYIEEEQRLKSHAWLLKVSADGCIESRCHPVNAVQEERPQQPALRIFPNPAAGKMVLDTGFSSVRATMEIHNSEGKAVLYRELTLEEGRAEVDIAHLSEGWYTVRMLCREGLKVGRLVVQR